VGVNRAREEIDQDSYPLDLGAVSGEIVLGFPRTPRGRFGLGPGRGDDIVGRGGRGNLGMIHLRYTPSLIVPRPASLARGRAVRAIVLSNGIPVEQSILVRNGGAERPSHLMK
jgi:hypothetical protein